MNTSYVLVLFLVAGTYMGLASSSPWASSSALPGDDRSAIRDSDLERQFDRTPPQQMAGGTANDLNKCHRALAAAGYSRLLVGLERDKGDSRRYSATLHYEIRLPWNSRRLIRVKVKGQVLPPQQKHFSIDSIERRDYGVVGKAFDPDSFDRDLAVTQKDREAFQDHVSVVATELFVIYGETPGFKTLRVIEDPVPYIQIIFELGSQEETLLSSDFKGVRVVATSEDSASPSFAYNKLGGTLRGSIDYLKTLPDRDSRLRKWGNRYFLKVTVSDPSIASEYRLKRKEDGTFRAFWSLRMIDEYSRNHGILRIEPVEN